MPKTHAAASLYPTSQNVHPLIMQQVSILNAPTHSQYINL